MLFLNSKLGESSETGVPEWADINKQPPMKWPFNIIRYHYHHYHHITIIITITITIITINISQPFSPVEPKTFLLGNPRIWMLNLAVLVIFPVILGMRIISTRDVSAVDIFAPPSPDTAHIKAGSTLCNKTVILTEQNNSACSSKLCVQCVHVYMC